jgi:predicted glycogen debranching enzyme
MNAMREWLEADGLGGFASGTATGVRTRRYHGVLLTATTPPTGRVMLVNGVEVWAVTPEGRVALTTHHYAPGVTHPDGVSRLRAFTIDPWPTWTWDLGHGRTIVGELLVTPGAPRALLQWTLAGPGPVALEIRPLLSGRDYHALQRENGAADLSTIADGAALRWRMYEGVPAVRCLTTGTFHADATWFRQFLYADERARGLDHLEDLASPGTITCDLGDGPAICVFSTDGSTDSPIGDAADVRRLAGAWRAAERRRRAGRRGLARSVDAYLVRRGSGTTIVAGYPWFTDWGRDTFIALRGLCLATDRLGDARDILLEWAGAVDRGMLPNRFPDAGADPEFNAVDASLWFVVAAGELLAATQGGRRLTKAQRGRLHDAMQAILDGYARGTRYGIRMDDDGLLAAGEPGQQLTWMDARAAGREVTPRIGKPVEVQALWINALEASAALSSQWTAIATRARGAFADRFWNDARGMLYDVVDVDHVPGTVDATLPAESGARGRWPARAPAVGREGAAGGGGRGTGSVDAAGPAVPGSRRARLCAGLRRRPRRTRCRLPPGHGVAVAARRVRRRMAGVAGRHGGDAAGGDRALPGAPACTPRGGGPGAHLGDRGCRGAARASRLSLPGVVARGVAAGGAAGAGRVRR